VNLVAALGLGIGLGVLTGLPLGVVNVAIVDAVAAQQRRYAVGLGLGCALADTVHSLLAFVGVGRVVTERPDLVRILAIAAALIILAYAVVAWRRRKTAAHAPAAITSSSLARGIPAGVALTLPNPGALAAWVAIAAVLWPHANLAEAMGVGIGVGIGSAAWFALLAHLVSRLRRDHPLLAYLPVVALAMFVAVAVVGVVRVL
jgi:threonine/homoserine/homoserine lactone efflux protein